MQVDAILYILKYLPPAATEIDEANMRFIANVISQLPENIQERVVDNLTFVGIDGVLGQYEKLYFPRKTVLKVVFLNFAAMKRMSLRRKETVIAHEIAHFILGHENAGGGAEIESATDDLCQSWGFGRGYKRTAYSKM